MSREDDLDQTITIAANAYHSARSEVITALGSIERDDLDHILSLSEEFGARYVRQLLAGDPAALGVQAASDRYCDDLELKLQRYVDANLEIDRAVADREEQRFLQEQHDGKRVFAFHGDFPVIDFVNLTVTFPGRAPEALILREGRGPELLQPALSRRRARGRGR